MQPYLVNCDDRQYYVVKFRTNRFGIRPLINELLAHSLASRLGLPIPPCAVVHLGQVVKILTRETNSYDPLQGNIQGGIHFGSRFVVNPLLKPAFHSLPDTALPKVENLDKFIAILAFDIWTGNHDTRQFVFYRKRSGAYTAKMIDHSHCFNWTSWELDDTPITRPFPQNIVYERVRDISDFEAPIKCILRLVTEDLYEIIDQLPLEWAGGERGALIRLIDQLRMRAMKLPVLIECLAEGPYKPFRNWGAQRLKVGNGRSFRSRLCVSGTNGRGHFYTRHNNTDPKRKVEQLSRD